jgi:hypothetical protein
MGYLLKTDEKTLMFYSKPEFGYYRDDRNCISKDQYEEWSKENMTDDMFWMSDRWYDVSMGVDKLAFGIEIDDFIVDCIMQGKKLIFNEPIEFNVITVNQSKCRHLNVTNRICNRCKRVITYIPNI